MRGGAARTWEQRRAKAPAHIFWEPLRCVFQSSPLKEHTGACGCASCNMLTQSQIKTRGAGLPPHSQVRRTRPQQGAPSLRPATSLSIRYLRRLGLCLGLGLVGLWRLRGREREACRCDTGGVHVQQRQRVQELGITKHFYPCTPPTTRCCAAVVTADASQPGTRIQIQQSWALDPLESRGPTTAPARDGWADAPSTAMHTRDRHAIVNGCLQENCS